jgi:hypothetical protein
VVVQTGDNVGIGGWIVKGSAPVRVIVRALGPSLTANGKPVPGALQDPLLELHDSHGNVITNDNWRSSQESEINNTGLAPTDDRESAIVLTVAPGNYTAIERGANGNTGIGLIEIYDLGTPGGQSGGSGEDEEPQSELGNLSVRSDVETGDNVLIDGVILRGGTPRRILFRALGPSLSDNGTPVAGRMSDPMLDLYDSNGTLLLHNDNWKTAPNAAEIQATNLAPPDDRESAILMALPPGNYTSIVRGVDSTTGISLNEAYKFDD